MFFVFERSFNNGGYMIIEIEYYKYHTKLIGGDICSSDLNRLLMQAEKLYDRESDNFERVLCSLIQYDIIETDERPDYVYDRDIKKLYKPRYN